MRRGVKRRASSLGSVGLTDALRYPNTTVRLEKLKQEIQAATGLTPVSTAPVGTFDAVQDGTTLIVMLADGGPVQTVNTVVGAHDPTTPSPNFTQAQTAYTRFTQAIQNWSTLTPAQKDQALVSTMQVVRALLVAEWGVGTLGAAPLPTLLPEGEPALKKSRSPRKRK